MAKRTEVVGAVIVHNGDVLCARRGAHGQLPGMWEFPGGKVEENESRPSALAREIDEELDCRIAVGDEVTTTVHPYDFGTIALTTFYCEIVEGRPQPAEHEELAWVAPEDLAAMPWAPADIETVERVVAALCRAPG